MDELHDESFQEIERSRAVTMRARPPGERGAASPGVDVLGSRHEQPDVVEHPRSRDVRGALERDVVAIAREVDVLGVGPPLDPVSGQLDEEAFGRIEVANTRRHVAQTEGSRGHA